MKKLEAESVLVSQLRCEIDNRNTKDQETHELQLYTVYVCVLIYDICSELQITFCGLFCDYIY